MKRVISVLFALTAVILLCTAVFADNEGCLSLNAEDSSGQYMTVNGQAGNSAITQLAYTSTQNSDSLQNVWSLRQAIYPLYLICFIVVYVFLIKSPKYSSKSTVFKVGLFVAFFVSMLFGLIVLLVDYLSDKGKKQ